MSAYWASRIASGARVIVAVALALVAAAPAGARFHTRAPADSDRQVRRITINDRGIKIDRSEDSVIDTARHDGGTIQIGRHGIKIDGVDATRPRVIIDGDDAGLVRVFADADVPAGERVEGDVVAVFGSVSIEGRVSGNVVAVFGTVRLAPGAVVDGDAVAIGGGLDHPPGATVSGESVSLGFLPVSWGMPTLQIMLVCVFTGWVLSLFVGWLITLLFPTRMLRIAVTASRRTGWSIALGLMSAPLLVIAIVLLLVTVVGIPLAFLLPIVYVLAVWSGQLASAYVLGCRLLRRGLGSGSPMLPIFVGTLFVAAFFALGTLLAGPAGPIRTIALFLDLLGGLLVVGLSVIGTGAVLVSGFGSRPREIGMHEPLPMAIPIPPDPAAPAIPTGGASA